MDSIDKWLKSLRLHKYTHLFKTLTYRDMLNLDERYLIENNVTKGARNKMLLSVRKLNLRQDRLINMIDDIDQGHISMKEALTFLKDMLVTPIPSPIDNPQDELTHLYIHTLDKLAARLIGISDTTCYAIMAATIDECLRHNAFTKTQKAKVATYFNKVKPHCNKVKGSIIMNGCYIKHQQHHSFREYSLLRPAITFELPCLKALLQQQ